MLCQNFDTTISKSRSNDDREAQKTRRNLCINNMLRRKKRDYLKVLDLLPFINNKMFRK